MSVSVQIRRVVRYNMVARKLAKQMATYMNDMASFRNSLPYLTELRPARRGTPHCFDKLPNICLFGEAKERMDKKRCLF